LAVSTKIFIVYPPFVIFNLHLPQGK